MLKIFLCFSDYCLLCMNAKIKINNQALKKGLGTSSFNSIFSRSNGIWKFSLVWITLAETCFRFLRVAWPFFIKASNVQKESRGARSKSPWVMFVQNNFELRYAGEWLFCMRIDSNFVCESTLMSAIRIVGEMTSMYMYANRPRPCWRNDLDVYELTCMRIDLYAKRPTSIYMRGRKHSLEKYK